YFERWESAHESPGCWNLYFLVWSVCLRFVDVFGNDESDLPEHCCGSDVVGGSTLHLSALARDLFRPAELVFSADFSTRSRHSNSDCGVFVEWRCAYQVDVPNPLLFADTFRDLYGLPWRARTI